ncbi:hypothetical protein L1987_76891 [Smallanthus sonchifolius]|uniref:Uncharacterized protein n=1 Tax=Smallanthus sonchifolius TaxID=185202 RepID=A0ACB8Z896_9ASTR|nr:hypothetical protein L1987_76891 [Smallanthus sonchifolius]
MIVMRRLKSIASGRTSVSDSNGDSFNKRVKQESGSQSGSARATKMTLSKSNSSAKFGKYDYDNLPKELQGMKIKEDKSDDKDFEATLVNGNGTEAGQIIVTSIGGRNGKPRKTLSYMAERVVGTGSFGVVFQAKCLETGEDVAIKKVLQDKDTRTENFKYCVYWTIQTLFH